MNLGRTSDFHHLFSLDKRGRVELQSHNSAQHYLGPSISKDLSNVHAYCGPHCSGNEELDGVNNNTRSRQRTSGLTWVEISRSVSDAGLTSVKSCPAADAISEPADWMAGCMRGASVSGLKVESGDGKVKEFSVVTSSICSIEDCMMFARAFNSAIASCGTLPRRVKHLT